ncbi:MAG TPA: helix-turn-helix transcriptional regulator [Stellaceae bacterium]|nr:helix-turn-helix transcriptional regulator [Stellaceae bacterium]
MSVRYLIHPLGDHVKRLRDEGQLGELISAEALAKDEETQAKEYLGLSDPSDLVLITLGDLEELIEDRLAEAAYDRTRGQETVPDAIVGRLIDGENPITVWREHRGMTLRALADAAGLDPGYLSQLENRKRAGPVATIKKLAAALKLDLDDLT